MRLETSFYGKAEKLAFSAFVYRLQPALLRAQLRFIPKDASPDATSPIPGARRSPREVIEGTTLDEVLAKARAAIEAHAGPIVEWMQAPPAA